MKLKILLLALFVAGLASSLALASPGHGQGREGGTTTAEHGKGKHDANGVDKANAATGCHNVSLKGTLADGTTISLQTVTKGNRLAKKLGLVGNQKMTFSAAGTVSVNLRVCGTGSSQTLALRVLKVGEPKPSKDETTTTTSDTATTGTTTGETTTGETTTAVTTTAG